jgi:uncharacterized protein
MRVPNLVRGSTGIDLRGIPDGTFPLDLQGDVLVVDAELDRVLERFRFVGSLEWTPERRRIHGVLAGRFRSACDRCLACFERDVRAEVDLPLQSGSPERSIGAEPTVDKLPRVVAEDPTLDLAEAFRAAVLLEVPIKNVCRADCRGLCPVCGADRNAAPCSCEPPRGDPRWKALGGIEFPGNEE